MLKTILLALTKVSIETTYQKVKSLGPRTTQRTRLSLP